MHNPLPSYTGFDLSFDPIHPKFILRKDLSLLDRLHIAYTAIMAQNFKEHGVITALAEDYSISRQFVYMLMNNLKDISSIIFETKEQMLDDKSLKLSLQCMLSLRLEGRCSIGSISTFMNRFEIKTSSEGSISQYLTRFGSLLPNTLATKDDEIKAVVFLSDEIFSKSIPILITVEPISSAILRIEPVEARNAENWKKHWSHIEENGYYASYLACDEGSALCSAQKDSLPDIFRQSDTYHAVAHNLGKYVDRLEKSAFAAIEEEERLNKILDSAKSEHVIIKRIAKCEEIEKDVDHKIELYENFYFLYNCLLGELNVFDSNGELRDRKVAEENIKTGLNLISLMGVPSLITAVQKVYRTLPDLLYYFDVAKSVVSKLEKLPVNKTALQALCLSWQFRKSVVKSKKTERAGYYSDNEQFCLDIAAGYLQENFESVKEQVYGELDNIVQSSALVECINSILRPYLNTSKNRITQETLNLIMFYHNHRRYKDGKRKHKTPMEILTGKHQKKDWIDLLFDFVAEKDPSLLASFNHKKKHETYIIDNVNDAPVNSESGFKPDNKYTAQMKLAA